MKKTVRLICLNLIFVFCICALGCGSENENATETTSEQISINEDASLIQLYYANSEWTDFVMVEHSVDSMASTDNILDIVIKKLLENDSESGGVSPVPNGMIYDRYIYDGEGTVTIIVTVDFENCADYSQVLSKAAITCTLCQLMDIDKVVFQITSAMDDQEVKEETYKADDFSRLIEVMNSDYMAKVYFPKDENSMRYEYVSMDLSDKRSVEEQIIDALFDAGKYGYLSPFSEGVVVKSVVTVDGLCTIRLNKKFANINNGLSGSIIVYSIVNSLTELPEVERVKFVVDGDEIMIGNTNLEQEFVSNHSLVDDK